ncbi:hypothetical protein HPP92_009105 [Vanilla planifolia]|uniref:GDSL esterase/lipase n=1 Tax=Vanilla planifolia TaxID=51239 RepID=A0A835R7K7_VANPL|nr:hypothetical protein HPP92_009105 [Vanilla planifolia]
MAGMESTMPPLQQAFGQQWKKLCEPHTIQPTDHELRINNAAVHNHLGKRGLRCHVRSVFFIGFGSNDYLNNYLMPNYNLLGFSTMGTAFTTLGARRFMVANVGVLGCIPSVLAQNFINHCSADVNNLVLIFNGKLRTLLHNLDSNLPGSNSYTLTLMECSMISLNPESYGFSVVNRGCCGIGRNRGQITCLPLQTPCPNRNKRAPCVAPVTWYAEVPQPAFLLLEYPSHKKVLELILHSSVHIVHEHIRFPLLLAPRHHPRH